MDCFKIDFDRELFPGRALEFGIEVGIDKAILEGDSLVIMKALEVDGISVPSFNPLIHDAKVLSRSFNELLYSHAKRDGNKLAYCLVRYSVNVSDCGCIRLRWIDEESSITIFFYTSG